MERMREARAVPVKERCDCAIVGGGVAGVAAALACARAGKRTLLIEKTLMTGGLATQGFVNKYLPICDGLGHKLCGSIAEELLLETVRYGYDTLPDVWRGGALREASDKRYMTVFSPYDFVMALDELLERAGVDVLYDALYTGAIIEDSAITALLLEGKEGPFAVEARVVIDATGDCDVAYRAGLPFEEVGNWQTYWAYVVTGDSMAQGATDGALHGVPLWEKGAAWNGKGGPTDHLAYAPLTARSVTDYVREGRRLFRAELAAKNPRPTLAALPTVPQLRMTRRVRGVAEITTAQLNRPIETSVGCAPDWRCRGEVYEIPFGSLHSDALRNVLTAGRCISATGDAWEVTRAIPGCAVTGEAAGEAAALMLDTGANLQALSVPALQARLRRHGAIIHIEEATRT